MDVARRVQFPGKFRVLDPLTPDSGLRDCKVFGVAFRLDLADLIQRHVYLGTFERPETDIVRKNLRAGMTFVDVGANVGYFTALAASLVGPSGRVVSFEPSPYAFERLNHMVQANRLTQVCTVPAGLSDTPGRLQLYLAVGSRNHTPSMIPSEGATAVEVPVKTLDSAMEEMGIEHIDLMKIDVEGYEPNVLEGAQRLLRERRVRAVLCEFNEAWITRADSNVEKLGELIASGGLVEVPPPGGRIAENRFFRLAR